MQNYDNPTRREINKILLGGVAAVSVVPASGCLPLLLRLVLGRAALSRIGFATRSSRLASVLVFGRGISLGSKIGRTSASRLPRTQIVDKNGRPVATSESNRGHASIYIEGSKVFHSRDMPYGQEHHSIGPVGRSINVNRNVVKHEDNDGRNLGYDRIRLAKNVIDHFDKHERKIGETGLNIDGQSALIQPDSETIKSLGAIKEYLGLDCERSRNAYQELNNLRQRCGENDQEACHAVRFKSARYRDLREDCNITRD